MDSILELDTLEIKTLRKVLKQQDDNGFALHETFIMYAGQLFQNSFLLLLSSGAKQDQFSLIKEMAESQDDGL